jgi:FMN-dependent NADH-azoreductase
MELDRFSFRELVMRLLHVDSSILGGNSVSRSLSAEIVAAETRRTPGIEVTYRDLAAAPLGHLSGVHLAARQAGLASQPPAIVTDVENGQAALEEFVAADVIVIGAPMYNFAIPSQLKAWIDRLAVAGRTFRYSHNGVEGLAGGKRMIIASSRGGSYGQQPMAALDHQETYLRGVFGFFGITDITFIRAEGVAVADQREKSIQAARTAILALA